MAATRITAFRPRPAHPARAARVLALVLAGAAVLAVAAEPQPRVSRSALIVGVSQYAAPDIPVLAGVRHDIDSARAIARAMAIPQAQTTVLRDAQATKEAILDALQALAASAAEGSRVFVYFSGHGTRWYEPALQHCREGLLAYDRETITDEEIAQRTRRMGAVADKVIVLFDACHSDGVSANRPRMRAVPLRALTPKFVARSPSDADACSRPSNVVSRGLLGESTRLGALRENFVQITSSRADEVSFDEPGKGGLATQAVRDCLLGRAADLDASGAVSVGEIQQCAQSIVDAKLRPFTELRPHHVTVVGNRNIVPVPSQQPAPGLPPSAAVPPAAPPAAAPATVPAPTAATTASAAPTAALPASTPAGPRIDAAAASLATLRDIEAQRNPRREVQVALERGTLRVGRDALGLSIRSSHDGYVYLVMLGSDRRSFYLLFPNGLDRDNAVRAGSPLVLPRAAWRPLARGPAGSDQLLVLVTETPRDLAVLGPPSTDPASPYAFALNDLRGRGTLIDFFTGRGVTGTSENFGARLLAIEEVP